MFFSIAFIFCIIFTFTTGSSPPLLNTTYGQVLGTYQQVADGNYVLAYQNIPYAIPPINQYRWLPPEPPVPWSPNILNGTVLGSTCIQPDGNGNEDCLYLSIYIPCNSTDINQCPMNLPYNPNSLLPIFFYIHGGGLMGGSGVYETPQTFAVRTNTIAITINYRLNILGFLATSALTNEQNGTSGNYGILDQQLALQWVQKNAVYFNGDRQRVTIAGQSSGGTSIFALLSSMNSRGLFSGAIALSGSPNITISLPDAIIQNQNIPVQLNCASSNSTLEMECMRSKTISELVAAIPNCYNTPGIFGLPTDPTGFHWCGLPIVDGIRINVPFATAMEIGLVDVSLIVGNMAQEATAPSNLGNITQWQSILYNQFLPWGTNESIVLAETIYNMYLSDALLDPDRAYSTFNADFGLGCAFRQIAINAKKYGNYLSPIYVYVNQWQPSVPLKDGTRPRYWVYHTWDYHTAFETFSESPYFPNTTFPNALDYDLAHYLQSVWKQLLYTNQIDPDLSAGWKSIEQVPHFPSTGGIQLISSSQLPPYIPNSFIEDYHGNNCNILNNYGFDERFWWCD